MGQHVGVAVIPGGVPHLDGTDFGKDREKNEERGTDLILILFDFAAYTEPYELLTGPKYWRPRVVLCQSST